MSKKHTVTKAASINVRVPSAVKRVANEMALEAEFSLSSWIDALIRKEAKAQGKSVKTQRKIPAHESIESRSDL